MRHARALILLPAILTCGPASAEVTPVEIDRALKQVQRAYTALNEGDPMKAEVLFLKALRQMENLPEAHLGLGHLAMQEQRHEKALYHYERARDSYPDLFEELFEFRSTQYAKAQERIIDAQDTIFRLQQPTTTRGDWRYQVSKLENEVARLQAIKPPSRKSDGDAPGEIYFYIGNALFRLNRLDEAIAAWEICRERSPDFGANHNNLAMAYLMKGRPLQARLSIERAERAGFPVDEDLRARIESEQ